MNRNYTRPQINADWALSRETHQAVATAIHAIADSSRSAEAIWDAPTPAEWDHVVMAVEEYVRLGDFPAEPDGRYPWGMEFVVLETEAPTTTKPHVDQLIAEDPATLGLAIVRDTTADLQQRLWLRQDGTWAAAGPVTQVDWPDDVQLFATHDEAKAFAAQRLPSAPDQYGRYGFEIVKARPSATYKIVASIDAEQTDGYSVYDYFSDGALDRLFKTREEAEDLAAASYRGPDVDGIGCSFAVVESGYSIGDRVCSGRPGTEDYDEGKLLGLSDNGQPLIAWDSGVRTTCPLSELRPLD